MGRSERRVWVLGGLVRVCGDARSGPTVPFGQLPAQLWKLPRTQARASSRLQQPPIREKPHVPGIYPAPGQSSQRLQRPWRTAFEASFEASKSGTRIAYPWTMAHSALTDSRGVSREWTGACGHAGDWHGRWNDHDGDGQGKDRAKGQRPGDGEQQP